MSEIEQKQAKWLELLLAMAKAQINLDVATGVLPPDIDNFSDTHSYVDGNCYGGICDERVFDAIVCDLGGRDQDEYTPDAAMKVIADLQDHLDIWMRQGRPQ